MKKLFVTLSIVVWLTMMAGCTTPAPQETISVESTGEIDTQTISSGESTLLTTGENTIGTGDSTWANQESGAVVFDSCGDRTKYKSYERYRDLDSKLSALGIVETTDTRYKDYDISDMCYASSRNQVVINVPYMFSTLYTCTADGEWRWKDTRCIEPLNIFSYNTKTKELQKAIRNSNTIEEKQVKENLKDKIQLSHRDSYRTAWASSNITITLFDFDNRVDDYIIMKSGYGDAGCTSTYTWRYYYQTNIITAYSLEGGCYDENDTYDWSTTYFK